MEHRIPNKIWSDSEAFADGTETTGEGASDENLDDLACAELDAVAVRHALDRLPDAQRHFIDLAYCRGMTYERIAKEPGIPLGTVKYESAQRSSACVSYSTR